MTMRTRRHHGGFLAAVAAALMALLPSCILDVDKQVLLTASDTATDRDSVDFDTDRDQDLPDIDIVPELSECGHECVEGWTAACSSDKSWCISPYRFTGDCCEAWSDCKSLSGDAVPGIWANAGPHDGIVPADFYDIMALPGVVIVFSSVNTSDTSILRANFVCLDSEGKKNESGALYDFPATLDCSGQTCEVYQGDYCPGAYIGCGCDLPYWCVVVMP